VSRYQNGKTDLDFTEARDSEWQWHQLGHMHICTSLQTDNHACTPPLSFLQAGCPSCHPINSVKALKATLAHHACNTIKLRGCKLLNFTSFNYGLQLNSPAVKPTDHEIQRFTHYHEYKLILASQQGLRNQAVTG